ncbi:hypothetical protein DFH09DRAFT_1426167 [Mycena vulgaris]|nr:hypothetical protein DFH09DRAFT_1426167 [Mycena vulgaris]
MRAHFLSLLLVLCTLLASQAAPIDSRAAPKPVKAAPKPVPVKAAPKPVPKPVKAAPKPVPVKAAPKPVPKPVKAAPKPVPKPAPVPVKAVPKPVKAQPAAPPKTSQVATGAACPVRKKGSKAGVKALGAGLNCAFNVKGGKCVPETTTGLTLAKNKQQCDTLVAAEKSSAPPAVDVEGTSSKKNSGRHMLTVWTTDNPTSKEKKRDKATGVVEFQNGKGIKDIKTNLRRSEYVSAKIAGDDLFSEHSTDGDDSEAPRYIDPRARVQVSDDESDGAPDAGASSSAKTVI